MARKVAEAWGFNYDKQNLFPPPTPMEDMEDAAEDAYNVQPRPTLRSRPYGQMPLIVRPEYKGDFLEQLRDKNKNKSASDPDNLLDFSMPEEMLKHQEDPCPRDLRDEFYEYNRPGEGQGYDALKDTYKRDWEETDAPEMSEDKILRMRKVILPPDKTFKENVFRTAVQSSMKTSLDPRMIVARFLMDLCPLTLEDQGNLKTAKLLKELESTQMFTKGVWHKPESGGVSVRLYRAEQKIGRWTFRTSSGKDSYLTIFQFIPERGIVQAEKLNVQVSCSCPSFLYWGAQYNAIMGDYLYGKVRPKFTPPKKRDPNQRFLVCKHILACIPIVSNYRLVPMTEEVRKRLKGPQKYEIDKKAPKEKIKIPSDLVPIGEQPNMKILIDNWDEMSRPKRRRSILELESPEEVAYMAHRFPDTATIFVIEKLKDMARKEKKAKDREEAKTLLQEII